MRRTILLLAVLVATATSCGNEPDSLAYEDELRGWGGEVIDGEELREGSTTTSIATTSTTTAPSKPATVEPDIVVVATTAPPEPVTEFTGTVIFRQNRSGSEGNLFALSLATLESRQLTNVADGDEVTDAALSPDGTSVAYFVESEDEVGFVHVFDLKTETDVQLTDFRSEFWKMAWSADGDRIFYNGDRLGRDGLRLYAFDVADGQFTALTGPHGNWMNLVGSGPGALVYDQYNDDGDDLFVHVDPNTLEVVSVTPTPNYVQTQFSQRDTIAYGQWKDDAGPGEADELALTSNGFEIETISEDAMYASLNASPDGTMHWRVIDDTLLLGQAGSTASMPLTENPEESNYDVQWMPDSAGVVYSVSTASENSRQFHASTPDGRVTNLGNSGYLVGVTAVELAR